MRRTALLLLALAAGTSLAAGFSQKDTPINTRYRETPEEAAAREFKEHTAKLPPLPDTHSDGWFDIYVDENYGKQPKILLDSLQIMPAPDGSIRYILNIRSDKGYDNLTAEGIFCARFSIRFGNGKPSSYKVFGYGDTVNRRWIQPRNADRRYIKPQRRTAHRPVSGILRGRCTRRHERFGTTPERTCRTLCPVDKAAQQITRHKNTV